MKAVKLEFVDSMHEQREYNDRVVPIKGSWLELGTFTPVVERFDARERYECVGLEQAGRGKGVTLCAELKPLDLEAYRKRCDELAEAILEKHGSILVDTLRMMIIKGISQKPAAIRRDTKERMKVKLDYLEHPENSVKHAKIKDARKALERHEKTIEKIKKDIGDLEGKP